MRKLIHNVLFKNAEIAAGILSCFMAYIIISSTITLFEEMLSLIYLIFLIFTYVFILLIFFMGTYLFEEYCYDQKTESKNWENNKYKS